MRTTCFEIYFNPVYLYVRRSFELATDNNCALTITSTSLVGVAQFAERIFNIDLFGISNYLLMLVLLTVMIDAYYGVRKSKKISREAYIDAQKYEEGTPERKKFLRIYELKKFSPRKLQFTFFKCFTLLGYLFFVKHLLKADPEGSLAEVMGFTSGLILKTPLAIFWYYDFKSIGDNSAYLYNKKAPIFKIVESIFELKIKNLLKDDER